MCDAGGDLLTSINALTSAALQPVPNLIDSAVEMCTCTREHLSSKYCI